jgi:hypothetical protein
LAETAVLDLQAYMLKRTMDTGGAVATEMSELLGKATF